MKKSELIEKAIEILMNDGDTFTRCVEELDNWNGFADGYRCFPMSELDDLFYGVTVSEFLMKIDKDNFDLSDDYIQDTIYGLRSVDDLESAYRENVSNEELVDNLIDDYNNLDLNWIDSELDEIIEMLYNEDFE